MPHNESTLDKAIRYLEQQQQMNGNLLFKEPKRTSPHAPNTHTASVEKRAEATVKQASENGGMSADTVAVPAKQPVKSTTKQRFIMPTRKTAMFENSPEWMNAPDLPVLYEQIHTCLNCALGATRTKFVFGVGNPNADIMVIGEAPGADEDAQGEPFVGAAGQLLTKILAAIGITREEVYIANIIKCRPPGNRPPEKNETEQCEPYLMKQIELIQPKFILAVGLTAANTLLKSQNKMAEIRGKIIDFHGVTMIVTYHPAALLRNPNWKQATWEDVQLLQKLYQESKAGAA